MRKYLIAILIMLGLAAAVPARAAFWSKWFVKKPAPAIVIQQPVKVVDKRDVEKRIHTIEEIAVGIYKGSKDVSLTFTEEELKQVVLPLANANLKKMPQVPTSSINNAALQDGILQIYGTITKPLKGNFMVEIVPSAEKGKLKIEINKIKFEWLNIPKAWIYKILEMNKVKPEHLVNKLPNFNLSDVVIKDGKITFKGKYAKD